MNQKSLCDLDAGVLRKQLQSGDITAVALLESCLERIDLVNPSVNAVVTRCDDRAFAEARKADDQYQSGNRLPLLHGLPLLVKDLSDTRDIRTTYGSRCFEKHVPLLDSAVVQQLRTAGAIVIGKTNTPEFGAGANTTNQVFGATCNPFNPQLTSGGSSGGSAVALACGMVPLATGSDLGGSLRIPASFCSVVGMRPSPGVVPSVSHVCGFSPLWTDGPMARSVSDTALCLHAMSGYRSGDPLSRPHQETARYDSLSSLSLDTLRVGFSANLGVANVEQGIADLFDQRQRLIGCYFGEVHSEIIDLAESASVFRVLRAESLYAAYASLSQSHGSLLCSNVKENIAEAAELTLADTARAHAAHTRLFREFQHLFESIDVLVCPATAVSPFPLQLNCPDSINGEPMSNYYSWYAITWALSLTGCPVVTIPCGTDQQGLPFGVQVVGPRHADAFVLNVASTLERALARDGVGQVLPDLEQLRRTANTALL